MFKPALPLPNSPSLSCFPFYFPRQNNKGIKSYWVPVELGNDLTRDVCPHLVLTAAWLCLFLWMRNLRSQGDSKLRKAVAMVVAVSLVYGSLEKVHERKVECLWLVAGVVSGAGSEGWRGRQKKLSKDMLCAKWASVRPPPVSPQVHSILMELPLPWDMGLTFYPESAISRLHEWAPMAMTIPMDVRLTPRDGGRELKNLQANLHQIVH